MVKCPYCQEDMIEGFIDGGKTDICWTPKGKKSNLFNNHPKEYQVLLTKLNYFKGCKIKVFRCSKCEIEIINENDLSV